uniref:Uncharacterized protein n=1 Tax=Parastrongyloides trichosuri TaxID=131310 RepID=A0A0N4ZM17_PARTI
MISKNILLFLFLIIFLIEESNSWPKLRRHRKIDIPYEVTGRVTCKGRGVSNVKIELVDVSGWLRPKVLSKTKSIKHGKYILKAEVPYQNQKKLKLNFWHHCGEKFPSLKLHSRNLTKICTFTMRKEMMCSAKTIELYRECDENNFNNIFELNDCLNS